MNTITNINGNAEINIIAIESGDVVVSKYTSTRSSITLKVERTERGWIVTTKNSLGYTIGITTCEDTFLNPFAD